MIWPKISRLSKVGPYRWLGADPRYIPMWIGPRTNRWRCSVSCENSTRYAQSTRRRNGPQEGGQEGKPLLSASLTRQVLSVFASEAKMKRIELQLQFGSTLEAAQISKVKTDHVRLGQVVTNLISNAIRFTAASGEFMPFDITDFRHAKHHSPVRRIFHATRGRHLCCTTQHWSTKRAARGRGYPIVAVC